MWPGSIPTTVPASTPGFGPAGGAVTLAMTTREAEVALDGIELEHPAANPAPIATRPARQANVRGQVTRSDIADAP